VYFTDITNTELQYFHDLKVPNFNIKLTDILHQTSNVFDNGLFKIEEVISGSIYKIFPLFYTKEISSSNPNDKILENKCIICQKKTSETFITFISDENEPITDYTNYGTYFKVGDTLTTNQFNTVVDLLRRNTVHTDNVSLKQNVIEGIYGKYTFNINSTTLLDNGILVTDETLTNLGTVKLENPVFTYATYTLKLKVYHMTDVNVCDVSENHIVEQTLSVTLENGVAKTIPFNTLDYNYVISFDATIEITHTKPVIQGYIGNIGLTASKSTIEYGETVELTGQLQNIEGTAHKEDDVVIYFFKEE
jgi:hypothetical protein